MDNLKQISERVNQDINPNGGVGSILAQNHNEILQELIAKGGRNVGMPYQIVFKDNAQDLDNGECYFDGSQIGDKGVSFYAKNVSKDGNSMLSLFSQFRRFDYFHFKDFEGRSYIYQIKNVVLNTNNGFTFFYLYGFSSNPTHTYPISSNLPVIIEWIKGFDFQGLVDDAKIRVFAKQNIIESQESNYEIQYAENYYDVTKDTFPNGVTETVSVARLFGDVELDFWQKIKDLNPTIIVERWTKGRRKGMHDLTDTNENPYFHASSSTYKQDLTTPQSERPSVIPIQNRSQFDLGLKSENYFSDFAFPVPKGSNGKDCLTKGRVSHNQSGVIEYLGETRKGYVHLRFKLRISANGRKYFSAPFAHVKIIGYETGENGHVIRYAYRGKG